MDFVISVMYVCGEVQKCITNVEESVYVV